MATKTQQEINDHEKRISRLEGCVDAIEEKVARIEGSASTIEMLVKWVIVPLLVILGALIGVKLAFP